ncbi:hypothetical protein [Facilibium subflavum]|uniref:hypothetical protein n=1 Tax=Facilibium subflavum TaxID=2219058 RepID=UPI000E64D493|nr:hypothetical protein [Facilibium subflavum]
MQAGNTGISEVIQADKRLKQIRKYKRRWILIAVFLPIIIFLLLIISKVSLPIDANVLGFVIAIILVIVIPVVAATSAISVMIVYIMLHFFYKKEIGKLETTIKQNPEAYRQLQSIKAEQSMRLKAARRKLKVRHIIYWLLVVVFVIALIVSLIFYYQARQKEEIRQVAEHVTFLLKQKYHKDFIVKDGKYEHQVKSYQFIGYPVEQPELKFAVISSGVKSTSIISTYLQNRISFEASQMVIPFLQEITSDYVIAGIGISPSVEVNIAIREVARYDLHDNNLNMSQWINNHPGVLGFHLRADFNLALTSQNIQKIVKATYKLIQFLKRNKFKQIFIGFGFYNLPEGENIRILTAHLKSRFTIEYRKYKEGSLVINSRNPLETPTSYMNDKVTEPLFNNDLEGITSVHDVLQFIFLFNKETQTYLSFTQSSQYQLYKREGK